MQQNLEGLGIRRHDDEFRNTAIQRLGSCRCSNSKRNLYTNSIEGCRTFVGALLQLLVIVGLLDQFQNGH